MVGYPAFAEDIEHDRYDDGGAHREFQKPHAYEDADSAFKPHERRGSKAVYVFMVFNDDAGADEADTDHNIRNKSEEATVSREDCL